MKLSVFNDSYTQEVVTLFTHVFTDSENQQEGELIGQLVSNLISTTEPNDLFGFVAQNIEEVVGSIFLSRLSLSNDQCAFILSPVGIATNHQGKGLGQQLITFGIEHLKKIGVNLVLTYGDPQFYSKVGFKLLSETLIKAPFKLNYPEGWLGQALDGKAITKVDGATQCVTALNDQRYW